MFFMYSRLRDGVYTEWTLAHGRYCTCTYLLFKSGIEV